MTGKARAKEFKNPDVLAFLCHIEQCIVSHACYDDVTCFQAHLDFSPQEVFNELIVNANATPTWNPTVLECKVLYMSRHSYAVCNFVGRASLCIASCHSWEDRLT